MKLPISKIFNTAEPIRTERDEEELDRLADSMKSDGQIVPIKVRPKGKEYEVVYGNRRLEAARKNGATEIEAIVEEVDDKQILIQGLIENCVRDDMSPVDTAKAVKSLMDKNGWSTRDIASRGLMIQPKVVWLLGLLKLPEDIQSLVVKSGSGGEVPEGKITLRHIRAYEGVDIPDITKHEILKKAASEHLNVDATRQIAKNVAKMPEAEALKYLERPGVAIALEEPQKEEKEYDDIEELKRSIKACGDNLLGYADQIKENKINLSPNDKKYLDDRTDQMYGLLDYFRSQLKKRS